MIQEISGKKDHYIIDRELGAGATGKTYLVTRESDQKQFVLKWLDLIGVDRWKVIERFHREGEILKSMSFPGIPQYIELIEDEAGLGLIQTYIDGLSWQQQIDQIIPVDIKQVEAQLIDLLQILNYLGSFSPSIIHRDISPKNIMVDQRGKVWLIDFGSVQAALHQHSKTVTTMGTFGYMAPEQIMGQATVQSDLFSLGMSIIARISHTNPDDFILNELSGGVDLEKMGLELPPYLIDLIDKMIAPGLDKRFKKPGDALDQLERKEFTVISTTSIKPQKIKKNKKWYQKWRYWFVTLLMVIFWGGYISSLIPAKGEIKTYGGWFSGHGNLLASIVSTFIGNASAVSDTDAIKSVVFSPDGTKFASLSHRGVILWEKKSGNILYENHNLRGEYISFDFEGEQLWIQTYRKKIMVIDVKTGKKVPSTSVTNWMLEKKNVTASIRCDKGLIIQPGEVWAKCHYGYGSMSRRFLIELKSGETIELSRDIGKIYVAGSDLVILVASGAGHLLKVWDFEHNRFTKQHHVNIKNSFESATMITGELGDRFLIKCCQEYFLINRNGDIECTVTDGGRNYSTVMAIHEGRGLFAVTNRGKINVYEMNRCGNVQSFEGHRRFTETVAFSPDGTELLSGGYDQTVKLWKIK